MQHSVQGLPDEVYTVLEQTIGTLTIYIPLMRSTPLVDKNGNPIAYARYDHAASALIAFVSRMQS